MIDAIKSHGHEPGHASQESRGKASEQQARVPELSESGRRKLARALGRIIKRAMRPRRFFGLVDTRFGKSRLDISYTVDRQGRKVLSAPDLIARRLGRGRIRTAEIAVEKSAKHIMEELDKIMQHLPNLDYYVVDEQLLRGVGQHLQYARVAIDVMPTVIANIIPEIQAHVSGTETEEARDSLLWASDIARKAIVALNRVKGLPSQVLQQLGLSRAKLEKATKRIGPLMRTLASIGNRIDSKTSKESYQKSVKELKSVLHMLVSPYSLTKPDLAKQLDGLYKDFINARSRVMQEIDKQKQEQDAATLRHGRHRRRRRI